MHTEHLENVKAGRVGFGWFVSVAFTGVLFFLFVTLGVLDPNVSTANLWMVLAIVAGFFAGGWYTGRRARAAPLLHGIGIGLTSLLVWFLANLLGELVGVTTWTDPPMAFAAGALLLQMTAAAAGAWHATRAARAASPPAL
jgi:putative membrane protein (TIGR04086 family)